MLDSYIQGLINNENIEIKMVDERHCFIGMTRSFHIKIYDSGSRTCGSFDCYSIIKVVRNYTNIKVPNITSYGSFLHNNICYEYVISERIYGTTLSNYTKDKKPILDIIEQYKEEMMKVDVWKMGRLYFLFEWPEFPYLIVETFPCGRLGTYDPDPKKLIMRRISELSITLKRIYSDHKELDFFKRYTIKEVEKGAKKIIRNRKIGFSFQHCDIHPNNIVISDNDEVFLIDWEVAGVYPDHYGEARQNHVTGKFETSNKIVMLEQILIEFSRMDKASEEHIMRLLEIFMKNLE